MFWKLIGLAAAALTTFSFVPQIIKIKKVKSSRDVSLVTICQFMAGVTLWVFYGVYLKDTIIIAANAVTLLTLIILLYFYFKYR